MPLTFTSRVVCCPLVKASVNCVIMSNFAGNSSSLQRRWIIEMYYLFPKQAVNAKLI